MAVDSERIPDAPRGDLGRNGSSWLLAGFVRFLPHLVRTFMKVSELRRDGTYAAMLSDDHVNQRGGRETNTLGWLERYL